MKTEQNKVDVGQAVELSEWTDEDTLEQGRDFNRQEAERYLTWINPSDDPINIFGKFHDRKGGTDGAVVASNAAALKYAERMADAGALAIWASVNQLVFDIMERPNNGKISKSGVAAYRFLSIDFDNRPKGGGKVCATDEEHKQVKQRARNFIAEVGGDLPKPLVVDTGNGCLLLFLIDLPNDESGYHLMARLAASLAGRWSDERVDLDTDVVKDPSRVLGMVGTVNANKEERPEEGRAARMRRIMSKELPPREKIDAESFRRWAERHIAEHPPKVEPKPSKATKRADSTDIFADDRDRATSGRSEADIAFLMKAGRAYLAKCAPAVEGQQGDKHTFNVAGHLLGFVTDGSKGARLSVDEVADLMDEEWNGRCEPPWDDAELRRKVWSAATNGTARPNKVVHVYDDNGWAESVGVSTTMEKQGADEDGERARRKLISGKTYRPNDIGNADLFADYYANDVRYVHEWKQWIVWGGKRWSLDNRGTVRSLAMKLVRSVMADVAKTISGDEERQRYLKHVAASHQRNKVEAMISLAESLMSMTANELDTDVWLLNVENGTIDLRTGKLRRHRRDDLITKMSPVNHAAQADCPRWREHIDTVTDGDADLADYLQRAAGYCMTGSIGEQCFFLLYGQGNNGKTVFVDVMKKVVGDYGVSAPDTLLMDSRQRGVNRADEAELRGVRFASLSEPNEGERINEKKVKQLTNKTVNAMRKYGDPESFDATHKIWLDTNHKPKTNATDLGFWRRVKMIPFVVNIPIGKRIKDYDDVLASEEGSGILRWMLDGLVAWQERGLTDEPRAMVEAVNDYRNESDILGQFLADETQDNDAGFVEKAKLYDCYKRWCSSNGMEPKYTLTMPTLTKRLKERGYAEKRTATERGWSGLELVDIIDHEEEYDAASLGFN